VRAHACISEASTGEFDLDQTVRPIPLSI